MAKNYDSILFFKSINQLVDLKSCINSLRDRLSLITSIEMDGTSYHPFSTYIKLDNIKHKDDVIMNKENKKSPIVKNGKTREDYIKEYAQNIEEWGYFYSGDIVTRATDRRIFICKNGHERNVKYGDLKAQPNCSECNGRIRKYTGEMVDKKLQTIGMRYMGGLTGINNLINIKCHCGEETQGRFYDLMKFKTCTECNNRTYYTIESVTEIFETNKCTLLETEYINTRTPLSFICS